MRWGEWEHGWGQGEQTEAPVLSAFRGGVRQVEAWGGLLPWQQLAPAPGLCIPPRRWGGVFCISTTCREVMGALPP